MPTTSPGKASSAVMAIGRRRIAARTGDRLAGAHQLGLHAALQLARADAHEGDAVAVVGVHVGLDLEDEAGHLRLGGMHMARCRPPGRAAAAQFAERLDQIAHAEIAQRRAEEHRRQMAFAKGA
jgi:hypothetical protein